MLIRQFEPTDADALAALLHASVREAGIRDYSPEQVAVWSPAKPNPERYFRLAQNRTILVAVDNESQIIGYGELEPNGHIDHLYCHPDRAGTGVGSAIYEAIEVSARRAGIRLLFVEASEGVRNLFERCGFGVDGRNDFTIEGVAIYNYRMSKEIA